MTAIIDLIINAIIKYLMGAASRWLSDMQKQSADQKKQSDITQEVINADTPQKMQDALDDAVHNFPS